MLRVLHSVSNMARAGIETMLMNYYREMDRSLIQFDFLANKPDPGEYDGEIREMGGRVFVSPGLNPLRYPRYKRFVSDLLGGNPDIRIVHAHNEAMGFYALQSERRRSPRAYRARAHYPHIPRLQVPSEYGLQAAPARRGDGLLELRKRRGDILFRKRALERIGIHPAQRDRRAEVRFQPGSPSAPETVLRA